MFTTKIDWKNEVEYIKQQGMLGKTMADLSRHYGVSRQRLHQIVLKYIPNWNDYCGFVVKRRIKAEEYYDKWGNKEKTSLYNSQRAKFRAKAANANRIGIVWDLNFGDLHWPTHCPILGIELDYFHNYRQDNSPSFDRIDCSKGYVKGNVAIISYRANRIKNNGSAEEHQRIAEWLNSHSLNSVSQKKTGCLPPVQG